MKKIFAALAAGAAFLAAADSSFAGSVSGGTLEPIIVLENSCTVAVAGGGAVGQNFGDWPTTAANLTNATAGAIKIACSNGLGYRILLNAGLHSIDFLGMGMIVRNMQGVNPANNIPYTLNYNAAAVGDNNPYGTYTVTMPNAPGISATGNGDTTNLQTYDLKANVSISSSTRAVDVYTDTVAVTVQWP